MSTYATVYDLEARLSSAYAVPANAQQLLDKASELINDATLGRAQFLFAQGTQLAQIEALEEATCDQVEFWLEVGEEHDVSGLRGALMAGRVQISPISPVLAPRAKRTLMNGGVFWRGVKAL